MAWIVQRPAVQPRKHPIGQTIKKFFDRKVEKKVKASAGSSSHVDRGALTDFHSHHYAFAGSKVTRNS